MNGRVNVSTDDIRRIAVPVLRHRISCNFVAQSEGVDAVEIIRRLVATVPEPEPSKYAAPEPAEEFLEQTVPEDAA